jgi:6-pyruvoyltetrahydropterin/6-carboxytetrahydropterin synthase
MFQITVEEEFAAGHALRGYRGKCENLHGHNYKVRVTLEGQSLNNIGLLYDFVDLKEAIHSAIGKLDHQYMNDVPPFDVLNPSAENLAKYFYEQISRLLADHAAHNSQKTGKQAEPGGFCQVNRVTVWETGTTTATYFADGSAGR